MSAASPTVARFPPIVRSDGPAWFEDGHQHHVLMTMVSPQEGARAHHIIWSMRRSRRKPSETVELEIEWMRALIEAHGAPEVIASAARALTGTHEKTAFAVAADLVPSMAS